MTRQLSLVECFSQEIIDLILDNFRLDHFRLEPNAYEAWRTEHPNLSTLKACSVVCQAFTPRCQYHIYSNIRVNGWHAVDRARREAIYNMLLSKPYVASGVRRVSLTLGGQGINAVVKKQDLMQPGLLKFLRELQVTSMHLHGDIVFDSDKAHSKPGQIERDFIQPFTQTTLITFLDINFTLISTSILACFPNLTGLALRHTRFEPCKDYSKIGAPRPRPRLRSLFISSNSFIEEILRVCGSDSLPLFDLSGLCVFQTCLSPTNEDTLMLDRVFKICDTSLEELDVSGKFNKGKASQRIYSLSRFPRLATLSLLASYILEENPTRNATPNPFVDHCRFLEMIPLQNTVEKVSLTIDMHTRVELFPFTYPGIPGLDKIDNPLARLAEGMALEINLKIIWNVVTKFVVDGRRDLSGDDLRESALRMMQIFLVDAVREQFKCVRQSPNIVFDIAVDVDVSVRRPIFSSIPP